MNYGTRHELLHHITYLSQQTNGLLRCIYIAVPCGPVAPDAHTNPTAFIPLFAKTADPPQPIMLSKMLLNVLKRWGSKADPELKDHVVFELIPRQAPEVLIRYLADASFRVPRAEIAANDGAKSLSPVI
ncbi:hypothetical protein LZ30DRAFT_692602 [Colletotrichum cereale]|nr:hypothetical protein LZ30DRAFT_692602 [Colletotrichum cereale]